jgi:hypothetical protein
MMYRVLSIRIILFIVKKMNGYKYIMEQLTQSELDQIKSDSEKLRRELIVTIVTEVKITTATASAIITSSNVSPFKL